MRFAHFFVDRPIFATVVSLLITIIGGIAYFGLPVAQYPEIAPPTIVVTASYPGASAEVVADTVATPLEQEINGVENMLYIVSQSTGDGQLSLTVTFKLGTDLDTAQVLVQNRIAIAEPRLPDAVRAIGVNVAKNSPDILLAIHLTSPDQSRDQLYLSNYATLQIKDVLSRLDGVGDIKIFGARDYAMRVWLDPDLAAARKVTAEDILASIRGQNIQVASGVLGQPPMPDQGAFQRNLETQGRLVAPEEFGDILVKGGRDGRVTRLRDIARTELGAQDYGLNSYLDGEPAVAIAIFQRPGSNALDTAQGLIDTMARLGAELPDGVAYRIVYNPTEFIAQSVEEVRKTIYEAVILVVCVVILFLQTWRASIIPIVAIPVSLIGTFAVMGALGYSLNNLSLFGLVLAIGIVVDDAIVVVENVERNIAAGLSPREAAHRTMDEVGSALVAIALVLAAVFIPAAFVPGISGEFFRQFAVTIAAATAISCIVSLTLSPALAALVLKPHADHAARGPLLLRPLTAFFRGFNRAFDGLANGYGRLTGALVRRTAIVLVLYAGLVGLTGWQLAKAPTGFIPDQDQSYLVTVIQLPPGAALARSDAVVRKLIDVGLKVPGVAHAVAFAGLDIGSGSSASNAGAIFFTLKPFAERTEASLKAPAIAAELNRRFADVQEAFVIAVMPPPVRGVGNAGGFKMMVEDRRGRGLEALGQASRELVAAAAGVPQVAGVYTLFSSDDPRVYADIDRVRAQMLGVDPSQVFAALELFLGSTYVNDFNYLGRSYQVLAQADARFRRDTSDVAAYKMRNRRADMVPLGSVATFTDVTGPYRVTRYNLYPSTEVQGAAAPGVATGTALAAMDRLAAETLPDGFGAEWTELAYQEQAAGDAGMLVFAGSVVFVFLLLAALYESWLLPLAVILIVPMCLLAAVNGLLLRGMDVNILAQVGFVVLVGLAAKNAILIIEFAKQAEERGMDRLSAAVEAARVRLRPILMTSFAFILGVVPLTIASGAGAEMRQSLGTAVFFGMLGVTAFGLLLTPTFYVACRRLAGLRSGGAAAGPAAPRPPAAGPAA
ncbi:MAG: multidrug efflux RND transporter permease subunit [Geminicoccaceae bacterium]